ncbi:hypothetical protein [Streptomyces sp. CBMA29]|uniref:hypothetical protein n=1 Tax=Streptomyces sp. CBMA29 TaxID=1896314 RepID=UPI0016618FF4|nr:hypothetical protein [Streptomyces sp. CBMA29]MBD0733992.1 hypothetical protein [Streptomyces sp. CBMA29]
MSDETYNGWTNWATWFVISEMENNLGWYGQYERLTRTEAAPEEWKEVAQKALFPSVDVTSYGELSREQFENVDWTQIRKVLLAD